MNTDTKHIVRIAPSPTGKLHLGTLRTAYFNWLIANQNADSKFIVRIDDTDLNRSQDDLIQPIYDTLTHYGLDWDITFKQSDRFDRYLSIAQDLIDRGFAHKKDGAIMIKMSLVMGINWFDTLLGPKVAPPDQYMLLNNQVIIKSDGSPAYNFASAIDDIDYGVTWVVRGTDHIVNTHKQVLFYKLLEHPTPIYSHVGLLCHMKTGKKISKRDSDQLGLDNYNPDAVLNFILRLGWGPTKDDKSTNIITRDRAIKMFLIDGKMRSPNCKVDLNKLDWYNKKYNGINKIRT